MKFWAVIVTFYPDFNKLNNLINILINQNVSIVLVDNSDCNNSIAIQFLDKISYLPLRNNFGIAAAQNIGIKFILNNKFDAIMFFDQDSVIDQCFVSNMQKYLIENNIRVVAPLCIDEVSGEFFPILKVNNYGFYKKLYFDNTVKLLKADIVISSGMVVRKDALLEVGLMDEDYFIDYVDTDWCIRCKNKSVQIYLVTDVKMLHNIGNKSISFFGLLFFVHPAIRCYYQVRNSFLLLRKKHFPILISLFEIFSTFLHNLILIFIVKEKVSYMKMFFHGFFDGIIGKKGKK